METCYEKKIEYTVCPTNTWRHHCGVTGRTRIDKKRSMQNKAKKWQKTKSISTSSNVCKMLNLLADEYLEK